jgi:hypothetical protein
MSDSVLDELRSLGIRSDSRSGHALIRAAEVGAITQVRCAMEECLHGADVGGRSYFEPIPPRDVLDWSPTADHYPELKSHGGRTIRLAHKLCNAVGYTTGFSIADEKARERAEEVSKSSYQRS